MTEFEVIIKQKTTEMIKYHLRYNTNNKYKSFLATYWKTENKWYVVDCEKMKNGKECVEVLHQINLSNLIDYLILEN